MRNPGYGATQTDTGRVFVPPAGEVFQHDANGNLRADGRWTYTWDGENRLVQMIRDTDTPAGARQKLVFEYDHQGRRIRKQFYTRSGSNWVEQRDTICLYEGWNVVAELDANATNARLRTYVWGLDLSGTRQGAGGVGGLLWVNNYQTSYGGQTLPTGVQYAVLDGNGNVVGLAKAADATWSARYEYGPFGETVRQTGTLADAHPFRFSTKWTDAESGLLYYGYRYYNPSTGRWPNRDPIGIDGGLNPYAFVGNSPTLFVDPLGLRPLTAAEQAAIAHMRALQTAIAANPADKKVADKIGSFISDFTAKVAAIPENQKDPANVAIASTAIVIWDSDSDKFNREAGKEKNTPVSGLTTLKKEINITCNYYVADVIQRATGENLGKKSWSGNVWPPVANDYANPKKDARLKNFSEVQSGGLGDVISFPVPGDSGHVGIYLGYDIYISSRTGDGPGTTGKNPVQPFSGVQIKEVPTDERHIIIRHK